MNTFFYHVLSGRWFMVFASCLIMAVSGSTYIFSLYSNEVKTSLGYDQSTLNLISFFKDLGANVGIISGLISEISPPWVVLAIGATMNFLGYFMIWLSLTQRIAKPQVWQMCLYFYIGANSMPFANTGALVSCVKSFPQNRGSVIGLLKGYMGLSGAILTQLYHAFFGHDNLKALIFLIGWFPSAISFIFLPSARVLNPIPQPQHKELKVFYKFLYTSLGLAGFLMVLIILQKKFSFTRIEYAMDGMVVLFLLFLPLAVVFEEEFKLWKTQNQTFTDASPSSVELQLQSQENRKVPCLSNILKPPNRGEDHTILQALLSIDMLVLLLAAMLGIGGTLTALDNLGQIGNSLGYPRKSLTIFVSLVSIWNYLGRVVCGYASEILLTKYKFPRPLMFTIVMLLSCVGHLLIAFGIPNSLYFASVMTGFCFGSVWPLMFSIISELFGLKHYSMLLNFGVTASPLGSYILNVRVTGYLYDKEAMKQLGMKGLTRQAGKELSCLGVECYRKAFIIITVSTLVGCFVSFILVLRTREYYKGDIYKNFRGEPQITETFATLSSTNASHHEPHGRTR
ncbi:Nodulin-like [Sesbania bispinosa]|nr:Nodulin-like [Sesbania bispinosa]